MAEWRQRERREPAEPRAKLPWPEPRSWRTRVNGAELHLLEWGEPDAPPVLLVHGMRAHAHWFAPVVPALADRHRVLSVDLRGHGRSAQTPPYGVLSYASDVRALVDGLHLPAPVLIGHSMGGSVALRAAAELGDALRALVLVDSTLGFAQGIRPTWRSDGRPSRARAAGRLPAYSSAEKAIARFRLFPGESVAPPEWVHFLAQHAIRELEDGRYTWRFAPELGGPPGGLPPAPVERVRCPVLLVYGERSPIARWVDPAQILARFESARSRRLETVAKAYHHVFLDQAEAFNALLRSYLEDVLRELA